MNKKVKILFFCMIFAIGVAFSQNTALNTKKLLFIQQVFETNVAANSQIQLAKTPITKKVSPVFLSPNYYASQLGFFCKQEIKFDKITKIPFRFRLGSIEDCNRLEGKMR